MEKRKVPLTRDIIDVKSGVKYDVGKKDKDAPKNKFSAKWLSEAEKDVSGEPFMLYIRKHREDGFAWCDYCHTAINYSSNGKKALNQHANTASHQTAKRERESASLLPAAFRATQERISGVRKLNSTDDNDLVASLPPKPVSVADRVRHQEAMVCSFIAEHSLPLSLGPRLIELSQALSSDNAAQQKLTMKRTATTYKLKYGLAELEHKRLIMDLKSSPFSLNLDESTSKGNKKRILNVLACYFSTELQRSVTHLYCAIEMTVVSGETVFQAVMERLRGDEIPLVNLVSILTDSAAYMRGVHRGFHAKMKEIAPHLLDVDGDVCHHVHNIAKKFSSVLDPDSVLSKLLDDLYRDFDLSADLRQDLINICELLGVPAVTPYQRASHRWMSLLDSSQRFLELLKPLTIFYFTWLSVDDKRKHKGLSESILQGIEKAKRAQIYTILRRLKDKGLTNLGRARKTRITSKLFSQRSNVLLQAYTVASVFPKFKSFILLFQQETPLVHKIHDQVYDLLKNFLGSFMKHEVLNAKTNLNKADPMNKNNHLPLSDISCCHEAKKILEKEKVLKKKFLNQLLLAYQSTAKYMQEKLPHRNSLLHHLSALDPALHGHSAAASGITKLANHFPTLIKEEERDAYAAAVTTFNLSEISCKETDLDKWWNFVLQDKKFAAMKPIIYACLSIFTGPKVEASFSLMNNIVTTTTNRMTVSTYEAYLKHKYWLMAQSKTTVEAFKRPDPVYSPVDNSLVFHIQTACAKAKKTEGKITTSKPSFKIPKKRSLQDCEQDASTSKRQCLINSTNQPSSRQQEIEPISTNETSDGQTDNTPALGSSQTKPAITLTHKNPQQSVATPVNTAMQQQLPTRPSDPTEPTSTTMPKAASTNSTRQQPPAKRLSVPVKTARDIRSFFLKQ